MNFAKQDVNGKGNNDNFYSEETRKLCWMRETRIKLFLLMELEKCRNELGRLIRCHNCIVDNCPEEDYPPRPLPIPPGYAETLERRMRKAVKGMMPLTLKVILKTHYSLPGRHAPVYPKHPKFCHARHHKCRTLDLSRWGTTRRNARVFWSTGRSIG